MNYRLCIVDDNLGTPLAVHDDTSLMGSDVLRCLANAPTPWREVSLQTFVRDLFEKQTRFHSLEITGFRNPSFYLNHMTSNNGDFPNSVILDWDFGTGRTEDSLYDMMELNPSKVFVLTGNKRTEEVKVILENERFSHHRGSIYLYEKTIFADSDISQHKLVDKILDDLQSINITVRHRDRELSFYPSSILPSFEDFWYLESILGTDFVMEKLSLKDDIISQNTIEFLFDESGMNLYLDRDAKRLFSRSDDYYERAFGPLQPVRPIFGVKNFELRTIEEACEKGFAEIRERRGNA